METVVKSKNVILLLSLFASATFVFTSTALSSLSHLLMLLGFALMLVLKEYKLFALKEVSKSQWALVGFILASILSVLLAPDITMKWAQIGKIKYFMMALLSVFTYQALARNGLLVKYQNKIAIVFIMTIILSSISGLIGLFSGFNPLRFKESSDALRSTGMYSMAITYGYGIGMVSSLFCAAFIHYKKIKLQIPLPLLFLGLIFALLGLYFSYSRGAIIGFLVSFPFVFFAHKRVFYSILFGVVLIISSLTLYISMVGGVNNRLFQSLQSGSNMIRVAQYQAAVEGFKERPLTGLGYRSFEAHSVRLKTMHNIPYNDFIGHAHNNYLEILADTGILGIIFFLLFYIFWLWEILKRTDTYKYILIPFFVSFAISGLFQNTIMDSENMYLIVAIYALSQLKSSTKEASVC